MKSERKQISLKMSTWHRIRALANAENVFMGDVIARIVDEWCTANGWRFTEVFKPGGPGKVTAICDQISLDVPAPAKEEKSSGAYVRPSIPYFPGAPKDA